ncbi:MAG: hypothetical protein ABSD38_12395 [Syntrophorhabdales bacterium]|jgi:hypothetical protein
MTKSVPEIPFKNLYDAFYVICGEFHDIDDIDRTWQALAALPIDRLVCRHLESADDATYITIVLAMIHAREDELNEGLKARVEKKTMERRMDDSVGS